MNWIIIDYPPCRGHFDVYILYCIYSHCDHFSTLRELVFISNKRQANFGNVGTEVFAFTHFQADNYDTSSGDDEGIPIGVITGGRVEVMFPQTLETGGGAAA